MRAEAYLSFAGTELANVNRVLEYLHSLGPAAFSVPIVSGVPAAYCSAIGGTYVSPSADPAPWYSGGDSGDFLGLYASDIELSSVAKRAVTDRGEGAAVGRLHAGKRLVSVTGLMLARNAAGMIYGERWLQQQLNGSSPDCADDTLTVWPACITNGAKTLQQVGLVDGPFFSPIGAIPECLMEQVSFQLVAGWPYLIGPTSTCLAATSLASSSSQKCDHITGPVGETAAGIITIVAGSADVTGLEVFGEPCAGYTDTYSDTYDPYLAGSGTIVDLLIGTLPAGSTLVIDGVSHTIELRDSAGRLIGGFDVITPVGPFRWPEVKDGAQMCITVASGVTNASTTVKIESANRAL